ncbi:MAG: cysteine desulfurase, partial [Ilumatobacteraceae bacterium]
MTGLDVAAIREHFPILSRQIDGKPLVYLDSANTSQKPREVIDAMVRFTET